MTLWEMPEGQRNSVEFPRGRLGDADKYPLYELVVVDDDNSDYSPDSEDSWVYFENVEEVE